MEFLRKIWLSGFALFPRFHGLKNDTQIPARKLVEVFFSRMGTNPPASAIPMSKTNFHHKNLEYKILDTTNFVFFIPKMVTLGTDYAIIHHLAASG